MNMQQTENTPSNVRLRPWQQFRWNLVLYFLVLTIAPVALVTIITLQQNIQNDEVQIKNQLESIAQLKADQIELWLQDGNNASNLMLASPDFSSELSNFISIDASEANPELNDHLNKELLAYAEGHSVIEEAFVYDANLKIVIASDDLLVGRVVNAQTYYTTKDPNQTEAQVIAPSYQLGQRELAMYITHEIFDENNQGVGTLVIQLDLATLGTTMSNRAGLSETGETYLVSKQNNYLLTPSRDNPLTRAYRSEGIDKGLLGENAIALYEDYRGVEVIGAYIWIPELQAVLLAEVEESEAFASAIETRNTSIAITLSAVALAVVAGLFYATYVARPIVDLTKMANAVTQGDYSARSQVKRGNEIGLLASTFNSMTEKLEQNIADLELFNQTLENRITARTRDLQVAGEVSRQITAVLDLDVLLTDVCDLIRDKFGIYHTSVFLKDAKMQKLRLAAGSGEAGAKMLTIGKSFTFDGKGLVPLAARTQKEIIIHDVLLSETHLVNPILPNTRSEIAFPMIIEDEVLGILDLQTEDAHHFGTDDIQAFKTLAEQIAIAVRNAQLYEDTKQAQQDAELANNVKSQFLASMSHELRTPLNAIINFSKFVARGMMGPVVDAQVDTLTNVINSAEHLLALINDVLDISKIESGSLDLYKEDNIDMQELVNSAESTAIGLIQDKPIELTVKVDPNLPLVTVDPQRMLQILLNIVSNACKFTKEGEIKIVVENKNDLLQIIVSDTGPGIAPEDQSSVFEKFAQTETGLRQGGGTGLGMPISKNLVEAHGGRIWIESEVGKGASFHIELPINETTLTQPVIEKEIAQ